MRDHLSELAMLGLISVTERNEGRRGGTYREYNLDMNADLILNALDDVIEDVGVHESINQYLNADDKFEEEPALSDFS